ncbi:MAG: hypothetical protein U0892_19795 [Pirellulales bacterium]
MAKAQQDEFDRQMTLGKALAEETRRQQELSKSQQEEAERQQSLSAVMIEKSKQNQGRYRDFETWESQAKRFNSLLDKWEREP